MIFTIEKTLKDSGDKISDEIKTPLEAKIKEAKEKIETADTEELKTTREELEKLSHKMAEEVYKTAQANGGAEANPADNAAKNDDDVVDAEFDDDQPSA